MASGGTDNRFSGNVSNSLIIQVGTLHGGVHASPAESGAPALGPWAGLVDGSKVWSDGQDRSAAIRVAEHLTARHADIPDDPWLDRTLAERFTTRVSWVAGKLGVSFGPAEATLLTLIPLLHQALWTRAATDRLPDGPPESFYRDHSRLAARIEGHDEVRWWLFHRWLWLQAEVLKPESIADLLADIDVPPVITADRVSRLLQGLRLEPNVLCGRQRLAETRLRETLFGGTDHEEHVRTPLLGLALAVAYGMAIDSTGLSDIIVWHTPVDFPALHQTIAAATWDHRADCPVLSATCHHASVVEALREHTVRFDALLHAVRQATEFDTLAPLRTLPERASSDDVRPATSDGKPVFSGWSRFRMDEQRVQELLMGEQLYRDRSLAIRELYQNALDACRYRRAREEYLRRTADRSSGWTGKITFTQGVDADGRPYLDCTDNGVGMGISELTGVFARAGARFADLAEFRDEQVDWSRLDPPVELHPNSRFGIGVLSYFMLADEITITTCRMSRHGGLPDPAYEVTITGPGHLFEIRKVAEQGKPGTTVRLHLRADTHDSCVSTLGRLLAIAEFDTTAQHGDLRQHWAPNVFKPRPIVNPTDLQYAGDGQTVASSGGSVVWCEEGGGLLVDGLHAIPGISRAGYEKSGAIVNLTGPHAPRLSVDRTQILTDFRPVVAELQRAATRDLLESNTLATDAWLTRLGLNNPALADIIAEQAPGFGYFIADDLLAFDIKRRNELRSDFRSLPLDHIVLWRLLARKAVRALTSLASEVVEARSLLTPRPSDVTILCGHRLTSPRHNWLSMEELSRPGHVFSAAARIGSTPRTVAHRLSRLGVEGIVADIFPDDRWRSYDTELALFGRSEIFADWWRSTADPVPESHVRTVAARQHISPDEARAALVSYGFTIAPPWTIDGPFASVGEFAGAVIKLPAEERSFTKLPYTDPLDQLWWTLITQVRDSTEPAPLGLVLTAAEHVGVPPDVVAARFAEMGMTTPELPARVAPEDGYLLSVNLDGEPPWLDITRPVRLHHLIKAHARLSQSPFWAADRLTQLGFTVQTENLPYYPEYRDLVLLRQSDGTSTFLDPDQPVPLAHLITVSQELSVSIADLAERLRELGMNVPDLATTVNNAMARVPRET